MSVSNICVVEMFSRKWEVSLLFLISILKKNKTESDSLITEFYVMVSKN